MVKTLLHFFPKHSIWFFAFAYFLSYVPNTLLTKMITLGEMPGQKQAISGFSLLPILTITATFTMIAAITILGWWKCIKKQRVLGISIPMPRKVTFISGLLSAGVIASTILAYSFKGVSIVLMVLFMKGGVLVLAPLIDALNKRKKEWNSWIALGLSLAALFVAFFGKSSDGQSLNIIAVVDIVLYLAFYFFRLQFMSRHAKSPIPFENRRYFVEEQMIAAPSMLIILLSITTFHQFSHFENTFVEQTFSDISWGFTAVFSTQIWGWICLIGVFSQLAGIFGGLILLDKRANSFSVPVNRSSSILAGVVATFILSMITDLHAPSMFQLAASAMVILAIVFLTIPDRIENFFIVRTPDLIVQQKTLRAELLKIATQKAVQVSTQMRSSQTQKIYVERGKR